LAGSLNSVFAVVLLRVLAPRSIRITGFGVTISHFVEPRRQPHLEIRVRCLASHLLRAPRRLFLVNTMENSMAGCFAVLVQGR
jgi:hypothetical protein